MKCRLPGPHQAGYEDRQPWILVRWEMNTSCQPLGSFLVAIYYPRSLLVAVLRTGRKFNGIAMLFKPTCAKSFQVYVQPNSYEQHSPLYHLIQQQPTLLSRSNSLFQAPNLQGSDGKLNLRLKTLSQPRVVFIAPLLRELTSEVAFYQFMIKGKTSPKRLSKHKIPRLCKHCMFFTVFTVFCRREDFMDRGKLAEQTARRDKACARGGLPRLGNEDTEY